MAVVEGLTVGRQVFRAGRLPLVGDWVVDVAANSPAGIHLEPVVPEMPSTWPRRTGCPAATPIRERCP